MKTIIKNIVTFIKLFFSSSFVSCQWFSRRKELYREFIQHLYMRSLWHLSFALIYEEIQLFEREILPFFSLRMFCLSHLMNIYHFACESLILAEKETKSVWNIREDCHSFWKLSEISNNLSETSNSCQKPPMIVRNFRFFEMIVPSVIS